MAFTTLVKLWINEVLKHLNLRIDTLTADKVEGKRLGLLEQSGHFDCPWFPIPPAFERMDIQTILNGIAKYNPRFQDFQDSSRNDVGYTFDNIYYSSPDTEVLYTVVRDSRPQIVLEVGCGNSTKIIRQSISDGKLNTRLICIDPHPRTAIRTFTDEFYAEPVEWLVQTELFHSLNEGDILFIDSSHEIKTGNDVLFLYLRVIPELPAGVLIHIDDVFLPYDYPRKWVVEKRWGFSEQYLVQSLLTYSSSFDVIWAGHFLQRTRPDFTGHFPHLNGRVAKSLWIRKKF